jgi:hypothetical protein
MADAVWFHCPAQDADFAAEYDKMVAESVESRKFEVRACVLAWVRALHRPKLICDWMIRSPHVSVNRISAWLPSWLV